MQVCNLAFNNFLLLVTKFQFHTTQWKIEMKKNAGVTKVPLAGCVHVLISVSSLVLDANL